MKKILIILITIPLIFSSCEKEDESPNSNSNNPIGNPSTGNTGYMVDYVSGSGNGYEVFKTTNSGGTWVSQGVQYWDTGWDHLDFVY